MMERLYTSPTYGMWYPTDPKSLSSNLPPMIVFPEEGKFYENWKNKLVERGVNVRLSTEVDAVLERSDRCVRVTTRKRRPQPDKHNPTTQPDDPTTDGHGADRDMPLTEETYDEIVLCVLADTAKRLLGKTARWVDKKVLGSAKWSDDITVTHNVRSNPRVPAHNPYRAANVAFPYVIRTSST